MQKNIIIRIVLVVLMLYALSSFAAARGDLRRTESLTEEFRAEYVRLCAENAELQEKLAEGRSDEEMRRLAWERLGLVMPEDKIFYFLPDQAP